MSVWPHLFNNVHAADQVCPVPMLLQLQQELHVFQAKAEEQAVEIEQLKRELAVRPQDPDQRCSELQLQVEQLTAMTRK